MSTGRLAATDATGMVMDPLGHALCVRTGGRLSPLAQPAEIPVRDRKFEEERETCRISHRRIERGE